MSRFFKNIVLFLPFAVLMYLVFITIWGGFVPQFLRRNMVAPQGLHFTYERLQEVKTMTDIDILFTGNSRTYRSFDTRIFREAGLNTFNLGTSAQTFLQTEMLLKRYLQQLNPRLVVVEVSFVSFTVDGLQSAMDIIANDVHDRYAWQMMRHYNDIRLYNTWLYSTIWNFMRRNRIPWGIDTFQKNLYARLRGADTYIPGGFVEKELRHFRWVRYRSTYLDFREDMFEALERTLELIRQNGSHIMLVQVPYTQGIFNSIANRDYFDERMRSHNVPYYNFNRFMPLDDALHFYDAVHLNQTGAEIFSTAFAEGMIRLGIFD